MKLQIHRNCRNSRLRNQFLKTPPEASLDDDDDDDDDDDIDDHDEYNDQHDHLVSQVVPFAEL